MRSNIVCEPLEHRSYFSAALDPDYIGSATALGKLAGANVSVYQAVPGPGDRTFVLAERYDDKVAPFFGTKGVGLLTIAAFTADGELDPSFGTGGVALTGRLTQPHFTTIVSPGLLKPDPAGRLYFADDVRVLRFHANGTTDRTFGTNGAVIYSDASQPVALCDIAPVDNGVLVATTKGRKGTDYFSVIKIDGRVRKAWLATHKTGIDFGGTDGTGGGGDPDDPQYYDNYQDLQGQTAQFAQNSSGGIVLVRIETDKRLFYDPSPADEDGVPIGLTDGIIRQDAVVTRFDSSGHGVDIASHELRRRGQYDSTYLGDSFTPLPHDAVVLSPNGRVVLVQTDQEVLRFNLKANTVKRYALPDRYKRFENPRYHLLSDGNLWVFDELYKRVNADRTYLYFRIYKFLIDGTPDTSFADNGVLIVRPRDFSRGDNEYVKQLFIGASGRLYLRAEGTVYTGQKNPDRYTTLTLRRV